MYVGSVKARLLIRESRTLKDKRQVVRSIKDRLRNAFNVAVAEVGALENKQVAVLGVATVGGESGPLRGQLDRVVQALRTHPVAELLDHELDVNRAAS